MKAYEIILQQLGGNMFIAMTGATVMRDGDNKLIAKIKGSKKYNHVEISHNSMDLYDIRFVKIGGQKTMYAIKKDETFNNVYADSMVKLIESETGLCLSL